MEDLKSNKGARYFFMFYLPNMNLYNETKIILLGKKKTNGKGQ